MNLAIIDQVERATGTRPLSVAPMPGATSSDLYLLHYPDRQWVLRLFRVERWDTPAGELSRREIELLTALADSTVPAPRPVQALTDNGVIMSWLPGRVELPARPTSQWLTELACHLAEIHQQKIEVPFRYTSWNDSRIEQPPQWWQDRNLWVAAKETTSVQPDYPATFIHRDYHPVNVLWEEGKICGIVDWINACMGPVGIDVAHCRLNLALMYGLETAEAFLTAYQDRTPGYMHDSYWDLEDALGALPDVVPYPPWAEFGLTGLTTELVRNRLQEFVAAAIRARAAR